MIGTFLAILTAAPVWRTGLHAQTAKSTIYGVVQNADGVPLAGVSITVRNQKGNAVASATTDSRGMYRIASVAEGVYKVEARHEGYVNANRSGVTLPAASQQRVDFSLTPNSESHLRADADALGKVSFYQNSDLQAGELEDPSAGGGYSNSAARRSARMVNQYLISTRPSAAPQGQGLKFTTAHDWVQATTQNPTEANFKAWGSSRLAARDFITASQIFQNAVSRYPTSVDLYLGLGISLYSQGRYDKALKAFSRAAQLRPDDPRPYTFLAETCRVSKHPDTPAEELLRRFAATHPQNPQARYDYGLCLWKHYEASREPSLLGQAESEFKAATALDPGFADAHFRLGLLFDEKAKPDAAINEYQQAIHLSPDLATAHYRLAQDYLRAGRKQEAEAELEIYEGLRHHR
jgi:tetratricopeptide (TPR) repeat protein